MRDIITCIYLTPAELCAFSEMVHLFLDKKYDDLHVYATPQCIELAKSLRTKLAALHAR